MFAKRIIAAGVFFAFFLPAGILSGFTIAENGKPAATIVVRKKPGPAVRYAAVTIQKYIKLISGAELEIVSDTCEVQGNLILLGSNRITEGLFPDLEKLAGDSYVIKTAGEGKLIICGGDAESEPVISPGGVVSDYPQGTAFAACHLLELLGVNWLFPASDNPEDDIGLVYTKNPSLKVGPLDISETPGFLLREFPSAHKNWRRFNQMGCGLLTYGGAHGWNLIMEPNRYFKENPEYYALVDGKRLFTGLNMGGPALCTTNPEVIRIFSENLRKEFEKGYKIVTIGGPDSFGGSVPICQCERCRALDIEPLPGDTDTLAGTEDRFWTFVNEVTERATKGLDDCYVSVPKYGATRLPPQRLKIHPKVIPQVCITKFGMTVKETEQFVREYVEKFPSGKFMIYDYDFGFYYFTAAGPYNNVDFVAEKIKMYHRLGCIGIHEDGTGSNNSYQVFKVPLFYVTARLLWNPEESTERIKDEYYKLSFGPAAGWMRLYDELWRKPWNTTDTITRTSGGESSWHSLHDPEIHLQMYPDELMREGGKLLAKAKSMVKPGSAFAKRIDYFTDGFKYWEVTLEAEKFYVEKFKNKADRDFADALQLKGLLDKRQEFVLKLPEKYSQTGRHLPVCAEDVLYDRQRAVSPGAIVLFNPKEPFSIDFERLTRYYQRRSAFEQKPAVIRIAKAAPSLDEANPVWKEATPFSFVEMYEEFVPPVATGVKAVYDSQNLYLYFNCAEKDLRFKETAKAREEDKIWEDDSIEIMLNSRGEGKKYFHFAATSAGVLYDAEVDMDNEGKLDEYMLPLSPYNPKWESKFRVEIAKDKTGWKALVIIPFSDLGSKKIEPGAVWTANFYRSRPREKLEHYCWRPTYGGFHSPDKFGAITFSGKE